MKNNWHKDPYLYDDVPVLKNIPGVKAGKIRGDEKNGNAGQVFGERHRIPDCPAGSF